MMDAAIPIHDAIIAEACLRLGMAEDLVRGRDRRQHIADARHAVIWALNRSGLNPARIARLLRLNHSTVVHALDRASARPDWQLLVLPAVHMAGTCERPALRAWLDRGLRGLPLSERRCIDAYVTCTLLAWERHPGPACAYGMLLLAERPALRGAVEEALARCEQPNAARALALQVGRLGGR